MLRSPKARWVTTRHATRPGHTFVQDLNESTTRFGCCITVISSRLLSTIFTSTYHVGLRVGPGGHAGATTTTTRSPCPTLAARHWLVDLHGVHCRSPCLPSSGSSYLPFTLCLFGLLGNFSVKKKQKIQTNSKLLVQFSASF